MSNTVAAQDMGTCPTTERGSCDLDRLEHAPFTQDDHDREAVACLRALVEAVRR